MDATKVPAVVLHAKLDNVRVTYREPGKPERVALLETFTIAPAADGLFAIAGKGKLIDYPAALTGEVGPLGALVSGRDIRMAIQAALGNLRLDLKGALGRLDPLDGADLTLKIENPDLGTMLKKLQLPVFATGALSFDARLSDAGELTRLEADAKFGDISAKVDGTLRILGLPGLGPAVRRLGGGRSACRGGVRRGGPACRRRSRLAGASRPRARRSSSTGSPRSMPARKRRLTGRSARAASGAPPSASSSPPKAWRGCRRGCRRSPCR